ncbi:hypothetical protein SUFG_00057 [Sulfitobacter phage phiCB2047-B]|uniref:Uncharacterized protein n=1 Tax=Sulfitobacter phage phiCB2047-B TaxID=754046 RepID=M4PYJ0_9CAUD|nr:hypothetical protein SUFG_00057 [Sulfitobacter phage phiCB2047-B]AGH07424.1 hypothetical protein SUFG_00057 [Sulfitobacter phage phiCB2047-B]
MDTTRSNEQQQVHVYYFYEEFTRTIFWSETLVDDRPDLIYLGSSANPNKKHAAATFVQKSGKPDGWKIEPLP